MTTITNESDTALAERWQRVLARLRAAIGDDAFANWCASLQADGCDGSTLRLSVPTQFLRRWLETHYVERILACCEAEFPALRRILFRVRYPHATVAAPAIRRPAISQLPAPEPVEAAVPVQERHLCFPADPRQSFATFIAGSGNRRALDAARQMVDAITSGSHPMRPQHQALYIHGTAGVGKTHLLQAISAEVRRARPKASFPAFSADKFLRRFAGAIVSEAVPAFVDELRFADILLIDDLTLIQMGEARCQLGRAILALLERGGYVVLSADCPPDHLNGFDASLCAYLSAGSVAEIGALDYDLRYRLLQDFAAKLPEWGALPPQVIGYLAAEITGCARDLEGAVTRLRKVCGGEPVTMERTAEIFGGTAASKKKRRVRTDDILDAVVSHLGVTLDELMSLARRREVVRARHIGMFLARDLTDNSLPEIARRFGLRDHSSVVHAVRRIGERMETDAQVAADIAAIRSHLK